MAYSRFAAFVLVTSTFCLALLSLSLTAQAQPQAPQWTPMELTFHAQHNYTNPYTDVSVYADFVGPGGLTIRRPAFWDGGQVWRVRFASPVSAGQWTWHSVCSDTTDAGLNGQHGTLVSASSKERNPLLRAGLLHMSAGHRSVVHADGTPFLLAGDTAWSLPWRGTTDTVKVYADDRQKKGFNCVLLMSLQPDVRAVGPRNRTSIGGFDVAFEDLKDGHLNQMNVAYFQYMDKLMAILLDHGIVPIYQPVFHGYGWKGLGALGNTAVPAEYARYCRYLVARYGARPALWLVGADSTGLAPSVEAGGEEFYAWDAYHQPAGIHYSPADRMHHNNSHQSDPWLDFQWCQTGHNGTDINKVSVMSDNLPIKGVADAEPTYEGIGDPARAAGWWEGNEAWTNLTSGGTMGVFYGAAALWQWKLTADEPGWPAWALDHDSWRDALHKEGSTYVGLVAKSLAGFDTTDMTKHPELAGGKLCAANPGIFYCVYLPDGGSVTLTGLTKSLPAFWLNPKTGEMTSAGQGLIGNFTMSAPDTQPWVLLVGERSARGRP
jgi:hypothetical protein